MRQLVFLMVGLSAACSSGARPGSGAAPVRVARLTSELSRDEMAEHVLNRLAFGARPGEAARVASTGVEQWISQQLAPASVADRAGDSVVATYGSLGLPARDLALAFREVRVARQDAQRDSTRMDAPRAAMDAQRVLRQSVAEVISAKLARAVVSERQLYEQMVDFWENHFSVFVGKGQTRLFVPSYDRDVIRPRAMGSFRDLLGAVAKSPAMLFYLDNAQSRRRGLNENYARELMELHTLGAEGGYTQADVVQVARALTGWSIDPRAGEFVFRPAAHDPDEKLVLGQRIKGGRGIEDGEQVLDILARHPSTARFIVHKLAMRFVSDVPPQALVERCSRAFSASDGDIRSTLQCVVTSPEFFSKGAYRSKVKTPFELVASALRATASAPDETPRAAQIVARLGQPIFGRQTPDGWPDRANEWMNAGAIVNRVNFGLALAGGRLPGVRVGPMDAAIGALIATPEFQRR